MGGYKPITIKDYKTGLVKDRPDFLLPNDAYPILENAFLFREKITRRQGLQKVGRLRRTFDLVSIGNSGASVWAFNIYSTLAAPFTPETYAQIENGSVYIVINPTLATGTITGASQAADCIITDVGHGLSTGTIIDISGIVGMIELNGGPYTITVIDLNTFTIGVNSSSWGAYVSGGTWTVVTASSTELYDQGDGTLATSPASAQLGTIDYFTGDVTVTHTAGAGVASIISFNYFPMLPVMGCRTRELSAINAEMAVFFDTKYAYISSGLGFREFIPGTTWTGPDYRQFWTVNYWISAGNEKLFWVTNFSGQTGDQIRYTDGVTWTTPTLTINTAGDILHQCLALLAFRGRLLAFNTFEGAALANSVQKPNRIRWSAIGSPLIANAWRDDITGKGGFLDIPTSQNITSVGFVRDNLVIYCERSTWQLRYTGRSVAPFQIERVNSELGSESTFSAVQFDTSLLGVGDKGVVECDSFQSKRIDIKIPDLVFNFNNVAFGPQRVSGIRDIQQRLVYWAYPYAAVQTESQTTWCNRRLVYNYENDSWAIFTDSITCMGTFQEDQPKTWANTEKTWEGASFTWVARPQLFPSIVGGNQTGYIFRLSNFLSPEVSNSQTLSISAITGNTTAPTVITIYNHNLEANQIILISGIPSGTPFESLNGTVFQVQLDPSDTENKLQLYTYNSTTKNFIDSQLDAPATYVGGGEVSLRDNFTIRSKKFNFMDEGQNIQMGYIDILMDTTTAGAITLNTYINYNNADPVNTFPQNVDTRNNNSDPDPFFNSVIPTTQNNYSLLRSEKNFQRVYCQTRGSFITLELTLSDEQMNGNEQSSNVQIDSQVIWVRPAGRLSMF